jgi:hypothetical protein
MATTYTLINSVTVGSGGQSSIDFTSIPATYTDLLIKISGKANRAIAVDGFLIAFNGSTSSFSNIYLEGSGSAAYSGSYARFVGDVVGNTATANTFGNGEIYIPNYTTANYKSFSGNTATENNAAEAYLAMTANLWSNTSAITSIALTPLAGTLFNEYTTTYLSGISNA